MGEGSTKEPEVLARNTKVGSKIKNLNIYFILNLLQWFEQAGSFKRAHSSVRFKSYCVPSHEGTFFREAVISSPHKIYFLLRNSAFNSIAKITDSSLLLKHKVVSYKTISF